MNLGDLRKDGEGECSEKSVEEKKEKKSICRFFFRSKVPQVADICMRITVILPASPHFDISDKA